MNSNFLGDVRMTVPPTSILSTVALIAREGIEPSRSMNFRETPHAVFLVLPREDGVYKDQVRDGVLILEGHDSIAAEGGGVHADQMLQYAGGRLTENGKFFKAAQEYEGGVRVALSVQVYEKLDAGTWFDKGMFDLVGAERASENGRTVFQFHLKPAGDEVARTLQDERSLSVGEKAAVWNRSQGRCEECGMQENLRFVNNRLLCMKDRGEGGGGFLG
jgi:hypothetical protein